MVVFGSSYSWCPVHRVVAGGVSLDNASNTWSGPMLRAVDDDTAKRWRAGWGPYVHATDPIEYEYAPQWTPRSPNATDRLNFNTRRD